MPTPENLNGASALMYHLFKNREQQIELFVVSNNANKASQELINLISSNINARIRIVRRTFWNKVRMYSRLNNIFNLFRTNPVDYSAYYKLPDYILDEIHSYKPDLVWLYPCSYLGVAKQLKEYKMIATGCDCDALHTSRLLRDSYVFDRCEEKQVLKQYRMRLNTIRKWNSMPNSHIFMVGKTDEEYFKIISPKSNVRFFQHPHYNLMDKEIDLNKEKLKVLISGKFDQYTYSDSLKMVNALCSSKSKVLRQSYSFFFLGKEWDKHALSLKNAGYMVQQNSWVEDYNTFISEFDIQLFPISVGTGTKGKVLDALSTGLLCIGSQYAFENISVKPNESCLLFNQADEIPSILENIHNNRERSKRIAESGKISVRSNHNPSVIMSNLLNWVDKGAYLLELDKFYCLPIKS